MVVDVAPKVEMDESTPQDRMKVQVDIPAAQLVLEVAWLDHRLGL